MNCREVSELAPLYFRGELDPARKADFSDHLRKCPACRQELTEQSVFDERLRSAIQSEPADANAGSRRIRDILHSAPQPSHRWKHVSAGIAAVVLISLGAYFEVRTARSNPFALAAARDHRMEVVDRQPRPWLTDRAAIEALAAKQALPVSVVSALTPAGYRLAHAKLCYLDGQWFLHLVYENALGNASVYLRRVEKFSNSAVRVESIADEHVAGFQHGQIATLVVTSQPGQAVERLAESVSAML
jgi:anti-sigma factor RsiW